MIMDAKTHNSNPPPGGGWVEENQEDGSTTALKAGGGQPSATVGDDRSPGQQRRGGGGGGEGGGPPPKMVVPDGGWGWVIVLANFLISFVISSINTSFGVMYLHLVRSGYTNTEVALIPAILSGVSNVFAPLSTGLASYQSHRSLSIVGLLTMSTGLLLCSLYENIIWFYICYGLISGLGFALIQPMGFLIVRQYFNKKMVIANGLSMLGASMGFMCFPIVLSYFIETYAFQGTLMLWSGIMLHGVLGASFFHSAKWHLKPKASAEFDAIKTDRDNCHSPPRGDIQNNKVVAMRKREEKKDCKHECENECLAKQLTPEEDISDESDPEEVSTNPNVSLYNDLKTLSSDDPEFFTNRQWKNPLTDSLRTNEYLERPRTVSIERSMEILPQIPEEETEDECFETYDQETGNEKVEFLNRENEVRTRPASYIGNRSVDSFTTAPSRESVFSATDVFDPFGSALSIEIESRKNKAEADEIKIKALERKPEDPFKCLGLKFPRFDDLINFSIFRHPVFIISSVSSISNRMAYACYVTYLPAFADEASEGKNGTYLLTCLALCELLGKLLLSVICDKDWIPRRYYCVISSFSAGAAVLTLTFVRGFGIMALCSCWYGFSVGMTMTVGPILLAEYLGLKLRPYTFGLLLLMNGITSFIVFPITGLLNDVFNSYLLTYRVIGVLAFFPGVLWAAVPCCVKNQGATKSPTDNV